MKQSISHDDLSCLRHSEYEFKENIDYMTDSHIDNYHLYKCWKQNNSLSIKQHSDDICLIIPSTILKRLENTCWRRWYKTINHLSEASPIAINWYKSQDITWLYGPKFTEDSKFDITNSSSPSPLYSKLTVSNVSKLTTNNEQVNRPANHPRSYSTDSTAVDSEAESELESDGYYSLESGLSSLSLDEDDDTLSDFTINNSDDESSKSKFNDEEYLPSSRRSSLKSRTNGVQFTKISSNKKPIHKKYVKKVTKKAVTFNYIINSREIINGMLFDYDFLDESCL